MELKSPGNAFKVPTCDQSSLCRFFKISRILKGQFQLLNFKTLLGFLYGPLGTRKIPWADPTELPSRGYLITNGISLPYSQTL